MYKAGFAQAQEAYDEAVHNLFDSLEKVFYKLFSVGLTFTSCSKPKSISFVQTPLLDTAKHFPGICQATRSFMRIIITFSRKHMHIILVIGLLLFLR